MEEEPLIGATPELGAGINTQAAVTAGIWLLIGYIGYKLVSNFAKTH